MIASWIVKRMVRKGFLMMNEDDFDVDGLDKTAIDDIVWDVTSEIGTGETIRGKEALKDWFRRWKEELPKRKYEVKDICFSRWPLCLKNVITIQWSGTVTDKQGKTFKFEGASVMHTKNFKLVRGWDYISFLGLPKISDLIEPIG